MFPLFGLPVGPEILVLVLIAVLLFGANKIPELARATGEATGQFKQAKAESEAELEKVRSDLDEQTSLDSDTETDAATAPETNATTSTAEDPAGD